MSFVYCLTQAGAEKALKQEVAKNYPELKFAYSRTGFVTFKCQKTPKAFDSIFARVWGESIVKVQTHESVLKEIQKLNTKKSVIHVYERDQFMPGDEPLSYDRGSWTRELEIFLIAQDLSIQEIKKDAPVVDIVAVQPGEYWIGHRKSSNEWIGGRPEIDLPLEAPSRAYLKIEECIRYHSIEFKKGDLVLEVGSAPGGAVLSLLNRGLRVIGVDPGEMSPVVLKNKNFRHFRNSINEAIRSNEFNEVDWIVLDMNVKPETALDSIERMVLSQKKLKGMLMTLKMNEWKLAADIPKYLSRIQKWGFKNIEAKQLSFNRQEICVVALL